MFLNHSRSKRSADLRTRDLRHPRLAGLTAATLLLFVSPAMSFAADVDSTRVLPTQAAADEPLLLILEGTWPLDCPPIFDRALTRDGNQLTLLVSASAADPPPTNCAPEPTPYRATYTLPPVGEPGLFDLEVLWIDTPFLPTMLTQASFEIFDGNGIQMQVSAASESEPGSAIVFGDWVAGCAPQLVDVAASADQTEVTLVAEVDRSDCSEGTEIFALATDLPWLQAGQEYLASFVVVERESPADDNPETFERAARSFDVDQASTRPTVNNGRFRITLEFEELVGGVVETNLAKLAPGSTADTALFYFFSRDNLEAQVKVLDACAVNGHYWIFAAASTDLAYTITVEDLQTDETRTYQNAGGNPAVAVNDTSAFATCP